MRSRVSMVMRLPSRSRCTSLPSLTARRPKVDSAISACRQYSEIWLRIWSFFIGGVGADRWAAGDWALSYHHLPTDGKQEPKLVMRGLPPSLGLRRTNTKDPAKP